MWNDLFSSEALREAWEIFISEFPMALWETFYVTVVSTLLAVVIGMPLGVLLVAGEKNGVLPLPAFVMQALGVIINLLRSVPFLILMI
ncbi:MAG: ABC transporter permease, partial [Clostridia bacterium]|nr:ABC transporter permease [Clostridia bacterium]